MATGAKEGSADNAPNGGSLFNRRTGEGGAYSILLASYAPGKGPDVYPPGMAKLIPAGSTIVLQIHYSSLSTAPTETK